MVFKILTVLLDCIMKLIANVRRVGHQEQIRRQKLLVDFLLSIFMFSIYLMNSHLTKRL